MNTLFTDYLYLNPFDAGRALAKSGAAYTCPYQDPEKIKQFKLGFQQALSVYESSLNRSGSTVPVRANNPWYNS